MKFNIPRLVIMTNKQQGKYIGDLKFIYRQMTTTSPKTDQFS